MADVDLDDQTLTVVGKGRRAAMRKTRPDAPISASPRNGSTVKTNNGVVEHGERGQSDDHVPTTLHHLWAAIPSRPIPMPGPFDDEQRWGEIRSEALRPRRLHASGAWRERRARHLADNPDCVVCGRPANHVDHVVNLASGGTLDGSLQSLCTEHHRQKTQRESKLDNKRAAARGKGLLVQACPSSKSE